MSFLMVIYLCSTALVTYSTTLTQMSIGYFLMGMLHLKITVSYTHMFELIENDHKGFCATLINSVDGATLGITGVAFQFITNDGVRFQEMMNLITSIAVVLYLLLIPESPSWLLYNGEREKAVQNLNYIARFNGSSKRIPAAAEFDVVSQAIR